MTAARLHNTPSARPMSRSEVSVQRIGNVLYLRPAEASDFKTWFAPKMAEWLRRDFQTPEDVSAAFGVRHSTAWNWWHGDNKASGDAVIRLAMDHPEVLDWFRDQWRERAAS